MRKLKVWHSFLDYFVLHHRWMLCSYWTNESWIWIQILEGWSRHPFSDPSWGPVEGELCGWDCAGSGHSWGRSESEEMMCRTEQKYSNVKTSRVFKQVYYGTWKILHWYGDTYISLKALKCNMMHHVDLEKSINKVVNNHFLPHFKTLKNGSRFTVFGVRKKAWPFPRKNSSTTKVDDGRRLWLGIEMWILTMPGGP